MSNAATLDLTRLAADLGKAGKSAPDAMDKLMVDTGNKILTAMTALVPVKTGRLKAALKMQAAPGKVTIGAVGVKYDVFVEFGTGLKGEFPTAGWTIKPKRAGGVLVFEMNGKKVFAKSVKHTGSRAHPFVRPAAQQFLDSLGADAARVGVDMIVGPNA